MGLTLYKSFTPVQILVSKRNKTEHFLLFLRKSLSFSFLPLKGIALQKDEITCEVGNILHEP